MIWPFKLRDLPETKNLLIPEPAEHQFGRMSDAQFELLCNKKYDEYRRRIMRKVQHRVDASIAETAAILAQNTQRMYHPSELQNAATDVDLFAIEMARNMLAPEIPDSPAADFGGGDSGGGGASDSWSSDE